MGLMQTEVVWKALPILGDYITELKKANNFAKKHTIIGHVLSFCHIWHPCCTVLKSWQLELEYYKSVCYKE